MLLSSSLKWLPFLGAIASAADTYIATKAPYANIFAQLTADEDKAVRSFLTSRQNQGVGAFTQIWAVNTLPPNKTEAVAYLDGKGTQPQRYAQATLLYKCYIQDWMIGPLPVGTSTAAKPLDYMFNGNATMQFPNCQQRDPYARGILGSPTESMGSTGKGMPHDDLTAPIAVAPDGGRYEFDPAQNYVSWMDFTFLVANGAHGVGLRDIRFKGQRVIYELALQEALAHYAGVEQLASETAYLDTMFGWQAGKLVPGFDCPSYATYTSTFCLFEHPKDFPIQRHTTGGFGPGSGYQYHVTKNIAFMVRTVVTVSNYDYQITFEFGLDGAIQVLARASGYIAWAPWKGNAEDPNYGFKIRDGFSGSMHDHVLNFKLDIDVNGTANSLFKTEFKPIKRTVSWSSSPINTMRLERSFITNEEQAKIDWTANSYATYAVVNKAAPNQYGEYPGWKIYPSTGAPMALTVQNSTILANSANWAAYPLCAVKRKDTEPASAHTYNYYNAQQPLVDFRKLSNGESLDQEDIVLYFNLGMHHVPDTFDMPNTMFTGAQSGVTIRPQNYGNSNPSLGTKQMVDVNGRTVNYYGQKRPSGTLSLDTTNPDLTKMG